jgi:hypothetical protein
MFRRSPATSIGHTVLGCYFCHGRVITNSHRDQIGLKLLDALESTYRYVQLMLPTFFDTAERVEHTDAKLQ